jgi:hypothetical protein
MRGNRNGKEKGFIAVRVGYHDGRTTVAVGYCGESFEDVAVDTSDDSVDSRDDSGRGRKDSRRRARIRSGLRALKGLAGKAGRLALSTPSAATAVEAARAASRLRRASADVETLAALRTNTDATEEQVSGWVGDIDPIAWGIYAGR